MVNNLRNAPPTRSAFSALAGVLRANRLHIVEKLELLYGAPGESDQVAQYSASESTYPQTLGKPQFQLFHKPERISYFLKYIKSHDLNNCPRLFFLSILKGQYVPTIFGAAGAGTIDY